MLLLVIVSCAPLVLVLQECVSLTLLATRLCRVQRILLSFNSLSEVALAVEAEAVLTSQEYSNDHLYSGNIFTIL